MATKKALCDGIRSKYTETLKKFFTDNGEEVLMTASNTICLPVLDEEQNERFVQIVVKVPTGTKDEPDFDGYGAAESYSIACAEKEERRIEREKAKAAKIARDTAARAKKKEASDNE